MNVALTSRSIMHSLVIAAACAAALFAASGCEQVKSALGYPTEKEISAARQQLSEAEAKVSTAESALTTLQREVDKAVLAQQTAEERKTQIRQLYAQAAQQLSTLQGAAADAMMAAMSGLQAQLAAAGDEAKAAAAMVAHMQGKIADMQAVAAKSREDVQKLNDSLDVMADRAAASLNTAGGFVQTASGTIEAMGVPGAGAVGGLIHTAMTIGLGGGAGAAYLAQRRRRRELDEVASERDDLKHTTDMLSNVITTNERLGLIKDDDELKAQARSQLGEEAVKLLRTIKAQVIT